MLTDDQINEIQSKILTPDPVEWMRRLARAIEAVATNDALERAAVQLESMQVIEENAAAISRYQIEHDETIDACAAAIRAMKGTP